MSVWSEAKNILNRSGKQGICVNVSEMRGLGTVMDAGASAMAKWICRELGIEKPTPKAISIWLDKLRIPGKGSGMVRLKQLVGTEHEDQADNIASFRAAQRLASHCRSIEKKVYLDIFGNSRLRFEFGESIKSGRLCSGIQNYPAKIRTCFLPEEGHQIVVMDYKSQELRILLQETCEHELLELLDSGGDYHRYMASLMFEKPASEVTDVERNDCKAITYGLTYGQTIEGLGIHWNISYSKAEKLHTNFLRQRPGLYRWFQDVTELVYKNGGTVRTRMGAVSHNVPDNAIINRIIQSAAADMLCHAICKVDKLFSHGIVKGKILLSVHDSLVMSVHKSSVNWFDLQIVANAMEDTQFYGKMPVDIKMGETWGAAHNSKDVVTND